MATSNLHIMKHTYIKPRTEQLCAESQHIVAVSIINGGKADSSAEVLTKENSDWDIWEE